MYAEVIVYPEVQLQRNCKKLIEIVNVIVLRYDSKIFRLALNVLFEEGSEVENRTNLALEFTCTNIIPRVRRKMWRCKILSFKGTSRGKRGVHDETFVRKASVGTPV